MLSRHLNLNDIEVVMNLKRLQVLALVVGGFVSFQPSYIHPDEHFQSLEVLAVRFFGISGTIPWEFQSETAARSFVPLLVNYGPLFCVLKAFGVHSPQIILGLVRLQNYAIYILFSQWVLKKLSDTGTFNSKWCNIFVVTSYLTCCFQSHSFSNSFETIVLLAVLALYNELLPHVRDKKTAIYKISCLLGVLICLGSFNRITFPAFILLPSVLVFWQFFRNNPKALALLCISTTLSFLVFILIDTKMYGSHELVIAPLENLLYNFDESNLELHGLHPRYQHILINLPQIAGPGVLFLNLRWSRFRNATDRLVAISIISGLLILSLFKHQELRFLVPLGPLIFALMDPIHASKLISPRFVLKLWLVFNMAMGAIFGIYHQSGVLKVVTRFNVEQEAIGAHVWWKTYSPPTWMYMRKELTVSTTIIRQGIESVDHIPFGTVTNHVIDLKGCDDELLIFTLHNLLKHNANVNLIAPDSLASRLEMLQNTKSLVLTRVYGTLNHLDLDHLDCSDFSTLRPGISIYRVTYSALINE